MLLRVERCSFITPRGHCPDWEQQESAMHMLGLHSPFAVMKGFFFLLVVTESSKEYR
jgi:hypothetical protein